MFDDEGIRGVEVHAFHGGQGVGRGREVEGEFVGHGAFVLDHVLRGGRLGEGAQHDVVGHEVGVFHRLDGVDGYAVGSQPQGVLACPEVERRAYGVVGEGNHFTLLAEDEVLVDILQGVGVIGSRRDAPYGEASAAVGACHADEGLRHESRVGQVGMESYEDAFYRFQIGGVEHRARYLQRVYLLARGKGKGEIAQGVALVVVHYGVGEVDGVGRVRAECVEQFHHHPFAVGFNLRRFNLRRRHDDFLAGIFQLDEFVERKGNLLFLVVRGIKLGRALQQHGRVFVVWAAVGGAGAGTGVSRHGQHEA